MLKLQSQRRIVIVLAQRCGKYMSSVMEWEENRLRKGSRGRLGQIDLPLVEVWRIQPIGMFCLT